MIQMLAKNLKVSLAAAVLAVAPTLAFACPASLFPTYRVTVTRVVDGDTFDARVAVGLGIYKDERVRILSINTPERQAGKAATERAKALLPIGSTATIATKSDGRDSFGRLLACVGNAQHPNIGNVLLQEGLAVPY
jgi:endonuclease YncB( thermonuclease family)